MPSLLNGKTTLPSRSTAISPPLPPREMCIRDRYLNGETRVKPGDVVRVKVEHADEYDLWGTRV